MICLKEYKSIIITLSVIALIAAGVVNYVKDLIGQPPESAPEHLQVKAPTEKILHSQKIKDEQGNDIIKYLYASETEVPAKTITADNQEIQEDISKRTKNAQFFKKNEEVWVGRFYAGEPFYKNAAENKWYQTETATTTAEEFSKQTKPNFLAKLKAFFRMNVLADTESYYAGAGDGHVAHIGASFGTWDTTHNATDGTSANYTNTTISVYSMNSASTFYIYRGFVPIDTSAIADDATIESASLYLYVTSKVNSDDDGDDWINVIGQTTQSSPTVLAVADYDTCGATHIPTEGSAGRKDLTTGITTSAYNSWVLNATGISWIKKTAVDPYTMLGVREGHDGIDSAIAVGRTDGIAFSSSEDTSGTKDPYLEVTYTVPPTVVTNPATLVASTVATANGNITDIGTATVTARGFKYGLSAVDTWTVSETGGFSAGVFKLEIPNLTPGTTYYIRAFAASADGTGYGSYVSFTTLSSQTGSPIIFKKNTILKENVILK